MPQLPRPPRLLLLPRLLTCLLQLDCPHQLLLTLLLLLPVTSRALLLLCSWRTGSCLQGPPLCRISFEKKCAKHPETYQVA